MRTFSCLLIASLLSACTPTQHVVLDAGSAEYFSDVAGHQGRVQTTAGRSERGTAFRLDADTLRYDRWSADPGYVGERRSLPLDQLGRVEIKESKGTVVLTAGILGFLAGGLAGYQIARASEAGDMSGLIVFPSAFLGTILSAGVAVSLTSRRVVFTRPQQRR